MKPLILALDQGSSSSRAFAFDEDGRVAARAQFPLKTARPKPGWVEHDALELARTQERALDKVLSALPASREIAGLALACQRSTIVLWDSRTGEPAAPALSWQDGRAAEEAALLKKNPEFWRWKTGLYPTPYYSAPKLCWLLRQSARVRALAKSGHLLAGPVGSFILWRLSKGAIFAADPTLAQRTLLMNISTLSWDEDLLSVFGVDRRILPDILPSAGLWGLIHRRGREIPVLACLGDQQAAVAGLGGGRAGAWIANYGTGAFLLRNSGDKPRLIPGLLASIGWTLPGREAFYFEEGTVNAAGAALDWIAALGLLKKRTDIDRLCREAKSGALFLPALGGLGAPFWEPRAKAAFVRLDSQTTPADLVRACVEGVAFLISEIAEAMGKAGPKIAAVRASGGVSRSDYLMQFQADILRTPVQRIAQPDATALGAASLALWRHDQRWSRRLQNAPVERTFFPRRSAAEARRLRERWKDFLIRQLALSRTFGL
ncbi:MAG TPA: FGGY family carbohydrate kinase [Elusimicrobiota bacterium]|nr:FGGY family carbohydrate kinase [Elusimicrobiota bacterium]